MLITTAEASFRGFSVVAEPQDYDGRPPFAAAVFDQSPRELHPDRLGMAAYLIFRPWISGTVAPPTRISPSVASMTADAHPVWLAWEKISLYAIDVPRGRVRCDIATPGWDMLPSSASGSAAVLTLPRSDQVSGATRSHGELSVPTNVWLLADSPARAVEVALGAGVLFAQDLDVDFFRLPACGRESAEQDELVALASSVGLGLEFQPCEPAAPTSAGARPWRGNGA